MVWIPAVFYHYIIQYCSFKEEIRKPHTEHEICGNCSQVISREVFCHKYGKIPRHTGQNSITVGDLEWILTKLL